MRQIRRGVFETNSSSSHSIVLMKEDAPNKEDYFKAYLDSRNNYVYDIWRAEDMDFGRFPFRVLDTFADKLLYAIATYKTTRFDELNELAKKYLVNSWNDETDNISCGGIKLPKSDWYRWDSDEGDFIDESSRLYYGDIDHQSWGLLDCVLEKEQITLEEFLTNPRWVIIIDGDEYDTYGTLKDCGLIKNENIEKEYGAC